MSQSKAMLLIDGETMLNRQIQVLRFVVRRVVIVGGNAERPTRLDVPTVPDVVPGRGPLAGVYTALLQTRTEFNLILGCDLPFMNHRLVGYLAAYAMRTGSDVTVPRSRDGRLQPLSAVYGRQARYAIRTSLEAGENELRGIFPKVRCAVIPWSKLVRAGFQSPVFYNMNTQEDYEYVRRRLETSAGRSA